VPAAKRACDLAVDLAERHRVDHIVVGHRGHTVFNRLLLGSVARRVIVHAGGAVTVVRD
jgi:nucleotide-binding universal stress UspA family protein